MAAGNLQSELLTHVKQDTLDPFDARLKEAAGALTPYALTAD